MWFDMTDEDDVASEVAAELEPQDESPDACPDKDATKVSQGIPIAAGTQFSKLTGVHNVDEDAWIGSGRQGWRIRIRP